MKSLRNLLAVLALICALAISTMAGDMGTGVAVTGDIGTPVSATGDMGTGVTTTAPGDMGTGVTSSTDPVAVIALTLLQSVIALF